MDLLDEYWKVMKEMRAIQKRYFNTRNAEILQQSKFREAEMDHVLDQYAEKSSEPEEVKVGRELRKWQRQFFSKKDSDPERSLSLNRSMEFERRIDKMVADHYSPQKKLF